MKGEVLRERLPILATTLVAVTLYVAASMHFKGFFSMPVFLDFFTDNGFLGIVAVGTTFVILTGGIDLSVGSMVGCTSIMTAELIEKGHWHPLLAMAGPLAFGIAAGAVQGILIARFGLPPFLVTLGGLFFFRGLALWISPESVQINHPVFVTLADFHVRLGGGSLGVPSLAFLALTLAGAFLAKQVPFGRNVYAIGGSAQAAELLGVAVKQTLVGVYAFSGFCAALGGLVFTLYTSSGNAVSGSGLELDAIAAVVIGGTLLSGGYGSVFGSLLGVLILAIVETAISFQGTLSSWWTRIFIGILLLVFMSIQKVIERAASRLSAG